MANFVRHDACPKCKSEDNLAVYDDDSVHCFGCHYTTLSEDLKEQIEDDKPKIRGRAGAGQRTSSKPERKEKMGNNITKSEVEQIRLRSKAEGNNYRGIDDETLKIYKCRTEYDSDNEVKKRYYPVTKASKLVGYKQRGEPKSFAGIGNTTASCDLYGSIAFPAGGKYLLIVEGEEDAHAAFQMLKKYQQEKQSVFHTAVVSVTTGASGARKQLQNNYAFLNSFEQIIVGFDADDAGNDGLQKLVSVLPKGKVKVAKWSAKDPNMMLVEGMEREFVRDFYGAKTHVPAGVIGSDQLYARLLEDTDVEKIPFPGILKRLNEMLVEGMSLGYIYNIAAGTGVGKTTLINEIIYHWIFHSPHKIGIVSMELSAVQYSKVLLSRHIKVKLDLLKTEEKQKLIRSEETAEAASDLFTDEHGNSRFFLVEDRDSSIEQLQETIEEMVISSGCRVIVLDPLQDVLDGLSNEEQSIFMKWCKSMLKSHGVAIVLINHIRKTEGNEPTENAIHGSSSIIKSAGVNIIIYRDKEAEDEIERNTTHIKVTKNRITGLTGPADELYYENTAHTLHNKEDYFGGDIPVKEKPVPDELKPFDRDLDDDEDQLDY